MKVLLVDDDPAFRRYSSLALEEAGIAFTAARNAPEAIAALEGAEGDSYDVVLLDVEMPGMKGWELLRKMRTAGDQTPVILVTVRGDTEEKVRGLGLGADDYITKPFEFEELVARLHAVLRRRLRSTKLRISDLEVDLDLRRVTRGGRPVDLSPREFDVLWVLAQAGGRPVSRLELLRRVWALDHDPETNVVQVHVSRLRKKLGNGRPVIDTVRGIGYRLVV